MGDIPLALSTATIWTYWFWVGVMVVRVRRQTHHDVGLVPEQPIERAIIVIWLPLVVLWAALPYFAFTKNSGLLAIPDFAYTLPVYAALRWIAAITGVVCLVVTARCWQRMGKDWRMGVSTEHRTTLITDGMFHYIRHPIYAFQVLLIVCTAVVVPTAPMIILATVLVVLVNLKARNEERHLLRVHGESYARYTERTGRFFPRLSRERG